jgi:cell fate regulator YaaT (PSP1 superfamily)
MQTVKVRLRKPRRVLTFLCDNLSIHRDETCVVESDRGEEVGICLLPPEPCSEEIGRKISMRVLRKFDESDEETTRYLAEEEARARGICLGKIKQHSLPMKLVDVEYTFDKKKVIFYFTADDRVDFRELVRDLAHDLRSRIELRHIQVRDEAKMVGGLGSCGRQLCCSSWLNEFKPISMRMAKRQNLSLNPSKISGQCGRLLCCLGYENEVYESLKKSHSKPKADAPAQAAPPVEADIEIEELPAPCPEKVLAQTAYDDPYVSRTRKPDAPQGQDGPSGEEAKKKRRSRRRRSKRKGESSTGPEAN